jgi:hypothetical protein
MADVIKVNKKTPLVDINLNLFCLNYQDYLFVLALRFKTTASHTYICVTDG